jgi:ubiquinone/menaquinone biosynthesis C-methylase UbiE
MSIIIDPEGKEINALRQLANWRGAHVLEVGCGDGRLTLRLASLSAKLVAFDPKPSLIRTARRNLPKRFAKQIKYSVGSTGNLKHPAESHDVVVFAWSL